MADVKEMSKPKTGNGRVQERRTRSRDADAATSAYEGPAT